MSDILGCLLVIGFGLLALFCVCSISGQGYLFSALWDVIWAGILNALRDPIWQGIGGIVAILSLFLGFAALKR